MRSLVSKMPGFLCIVEVFKQDVIGITESWASADVADGELGVAGYDLYRKDRDSGHKEGGVLLYVKSSLQSTGIAPKTAFPEQVWCRIPSRIGQDLCVRVCYGTPNPDTLTLI